MADTMARRIRDLEYWRNGNGSKGAEERLRDVETLAEEVKTGKACTAKDTLGSIQKKIDKLEKQSIWILLLLGILHAQKIPEILTFLKGLTP
jgi:hypothetical protein